MPCSAPPAGAASTARTAAAAAPARIGELTTGLSSDRRASAGRPRLFALHEVLAAVEEHLRRCSGLTGQSAADGVEDAGDEGVRLLVLVRQLPGRALRLDDR